MSQSTARVHPTPAFPAGSPPLPVEAPRDRRWKRPFDVTLAANLLLLTLPLFLLIALLIRLEGGGPAFFRQERVGRLGARFRIWKFRTMGLGAGDAPHRQAAQAWFGAEPCFGSLYKDDRDRRVTKVGRVLRRTDLDELPQLLNVLRGEMSLVGPRPAIPYELELYQPEYFVRQLVRPGMTGLWQVTDRVRVSAARMMALDALYVDEASLLLDLRILGQTALLALRRLVRRRHRVAGS